MSAPIERRLLKGRPFAAIDRYYFGSPALTIQDAERRSRCQRRIQARRQHGICPARCVSDRRALAIESSLEGLELKEFFQLLSSTCLAYRRCHLVRVAGDQIGVTFLARDALSKRKSTKKRSTDQVV
jgi:hypothetical protein